MVYKRLLCFSVFLLLVANSAWAGLGDFNQKQQEIVKKKAVKRRRTQNTNYKKKAVKRKKTIDDFIVDEASTDGFSVNFSFDEEGDAQSVTLLSDAKMLVRTIDKIYTENKDTKFRARLVFDVYNGLGQLAFNKNDVVIGSVRLDRGKGGEISGVKLVPEKIVVKRLHREIKFNDAVAVQLNSEKERIVGRMINSQNSASGAAIADLWDNFNTEGGFHLESVLKNQLGVGNNNLKVEISAGTTLVIRLNEMITIKMGVKK
jgi:hypothetical protein